MDGLRLTVPPFLLAFLASLTALVPTNVFKICRGEVGFLDVTPYLRKRAGDALVAPVSWFASLLRFRGAFLLGAAVAMALLAIHLSASHAHSDVLSAITLAAGGTRRDQLKAEMMENATAAKGLMRRADAEGRALTAAEQKDIDAYLAAARRARAQLVEIDGDPEMRKMISELGGGSRSYRPGEEGHFEIEGRPAASAAELLMFRRPGFGAAIMRTDTLRAVCASVQQGGGLPQTPYTWVGSELSMPPMGATTLTEDPASGGDLVIPDYRPGITPLVQRRPRMLDILAPGTTGSNTVVTMRETTYTNAAATVLEDAAAAESAFGFAQQEDAVKEIAHFVPVTERVLEDVSVARDYIQGQMRRGVELAADNQLLNGDGAGANLSGLLTRAGLAAAVARGTDSNADAIFKQIAAIEGDTDQAVDAIVMHPANWETVMLAKDGNGQYYAGGGPFTRMIVPTLWGRPVVVTSAIASGTALVGGFRDFAQAFIRRGITITASNHHQDYFIKRKVAIMATMRATLAVYRAGAFGTVTGLN